MKYLDYLKLYFDAPAGGNDSGSNNAGNSNENGNDPNNGNDDKIVLTRDELQAKINEHVEKRLARERKKVAEEKARQDEASKLEAMTEQEKREHELQKLQDEINNMKREKAIADMEKQARQMLKADGVDIDDSLVSVLVAEDADTTASNIKSFSKSFKEAVQTEIKKQLSHKQPSTGGSKTVTKEDILNEKDPIKRQNLMKEHFSLFQK